MHLGKGNKSRQWVSRSVCRQKWSGAYFWSINIDVRKGRGGLVPSDIRFQPSHSKMTKIYSSLLCHILLQFREIFIKWVLINKKHLPILKVLRTWIDINNNLDRKVQVSKSHMKVTRKFKIIWSIKRVKIVRTIENF